MDQLDFTLEAKDNVSFLIDDNPNFGWLTNFQIEPSNRIYVIIYNYVNNNWGEQLRGQLNQHAKSIIWLPFESLEKNKELNNFIELIEILEHKGLSRFDVIIGIGSGVLLDIVSFTASVYMRGVPLILIPTTLIGQVDAATGGKTCVNSKKSKNLIGTYYMPRIVYNNIRFLDDLNEYHWRQGFSEILKYALLGSSHLLSLLLKYSHSPQDKVLFDIIKETIRVRVKIRKNDPLASNLGHTFGHAMEKLSKYNVGHGDAIASGILMAIKFGELQGITNPKLFDNVLEKMTMLSLNKYHDSDWTVNQIIYLMGKDKKSSSEKINLVLIKDIEKPYFNDSIPFYPIQPEPIKEFLDWYFMEYQHFSIPNLDVFLKKGLKNNKLL